MDGVAFAKRREEERHRDAPGRRTSPRALPSSCTRRSSRTSRSFKGLQNKDYFVAALKNEKDHKACLGQALGPKTPKGFKLHIPAAAVKSTKALTSTGVALETAFVETYLGAVETLSSTALKEAAAKVAANEASHFSFFDAANGGHGVLPSFPRTLAASKAAAILKKDGFIS